ncbi:MAG: hypothetical protein FJX74_13315 [Armatimonadetes bacterium]|nr:hypothetical protein [Armatimonadota bacterium]
MSGRHRGRATGCAAVAVLLYASAGGGQEPSWHPPTEPSSFIPDDARWIGQPEQAGRGWAREIHLRGSWRIRPGVRRAVLMTAPSQSARVYLNGRLVLTAYDHLEALPAWVEATEALQAGENAVAAVVRSEWRPAFYAQMRVEYDDGSVEDLTTGPGWECATEPAGDRRPAADIGGYYRQAGEGLWGREFALLPREMLRERLAAHNRKLEADFRAGGDPPPRIDEAPELPEWAAQFGGFCRVDEATGQLIDGAGQVRHLFFTVYSQHRNGSWVLHLPDFDFGQYQRDLDLMAEAGVNLYLRFTGWDWLLTKGGDWAPLKEQPNGWPPHFERGIDLLDHFVRCARAHGRYIVFEGDFFWGAHGDVIPAPYRSRYHLYPEVLEAEALAMRKVMHRYSECPNVLGMMIGEEDIVLAHDLANPHQHALFADYLSRKYGSLDEFRRQTPQGYDYADHSAFRPGDRRREYFPGTEPEPVLFPVFTPAAGVFDAARDWLDIALPLWPQYASPQEPAVALADQKSYNEFTPLDPLWIDFYEMREDELLFGMLSRWAEIVREGMPNQLLFYSNAQDFTNSWHFLHLYRRAPLPFDVIGVGCHDSGQNLSEIPPQYTVRKAIKVISSYRPYALAPGSPARGIASGEGEGGRADQPEEVRRYYGGALFDEIGGGAAWTQTYTWGHLSGAEAPEGPHETPLLRWLGQFMPAVQGVAFPLRRPVQVLIIRNTNLAHSNLSGLDYGNAIRVAEALTQLNVEFDIVMDRDVTAGGAELRSSGVAETTTADDPRVDLAAYRLVILPSVASDLCASAWTALETWLADPARTGQRTLAFGWVGKRGPRLEPLATFPEVLQRWTGAADYAASVQLRGKQTVQWAAGAPALTVDFGGALPCGLLDRGETLLMAADGAVIARRLEYQGNPIFAFGFPMGLNNNELWDLAPQQDPRDALAPIYEELVRVAGVDRPVLAPHNLRVYLSGDGKVLLVRERAGLPTDADIEVRLPEGVTYAGLGQTRGGDGYTKLHLRLDPWESAWWKAG